MTTVGAYSAVVNDSFGEYDIILQRKPFGEYVAPVPDSGKKAANIEPAKPEFTKYIKMCAITDSARGVRVGLVSTKEKPARTYFMYVGDLVEGIELVDANYSQGWARLRMGDEEIPLYLESGRNLSPEPTTKSVKSPKPHRSSRRGILNPPAISKVTKIAPSPAPKINLPDAVQKSLSYAERRKMKLDEEAQKSKMLEEMALKYKQSKGKVDISADERKERLQKDMMELIRSGKTSERMPIVLTPEMETQLIKEGVLPPAE